jgi:hypothetical protein
MINKHRTYPLTLTMTRKNIPGEEKVQEWLLNAHTFGSEEEIRIFFAQQKGPDTHLGHKRQSTMKCFSDNCKGNLVKNDRNYRCNDNKSHQWSRKSSFNWITLLVWIYSGYTYKISKQEIDLFLEKNPITETAMFDNTSTSLDIMETENEAEKQCLIDANMNPEGPLAETLTDTESGSSSDKTKNYATDYDSEMENLCKTTSFAKDQCSLFMTPSRKA